MARSKDMKKYEALLTVLIAAAAAPVLAADAPAAAPKLPYV